MQKERWSFPMMLVLGVLSFIIPIAGWIIGGLNLRYPARVNQSWLLIVLGIISFVGAICCRSYLPWGGT